MDNNYVEPVRKLVSPGDYEEARIIRLAVDGTGWAARTALPASGTA